MPIEPREGESQDKFVSRCISVEVDSGTKHKQAIAICFNVWRKSGHEIKETKAASELFDVLREGFGISKQHFESFEWVPEITAELPHGARLYKVKCMRAGKTYHFDKDGKPYERVFTEEELMQNGRSLAAALAKVNLDHFQPLDGRNVVVYSNYNKETKDLEAIIYIEDQLFHKLFDERHISGSSPEYRWISEKLTADGLQQIGTMFNGLGIMTDRFGDRPASHDTLVERFLSYSDQLMSTKRKNMTTEDLEKRMKDVEALAKENAVSVKKLSEKTPTVEEAIDAIGKAHGIDATKLLAMKNVVNPTEKPEDRKAKFEVDIATVSNILEGQKAASKLLSGKDVNLESVKTRLTALGKERVKLEGALFGDKIPDNAADMIGQLQTAMGEIQVLEQTVTLAGADGKIKKEGMLGLKAGLTGDKKDFKPSPALEKAWLERYGEIPNIEDEAA